MKRWRVESSMFIAINYDPKTLVMELELHDGSVWRYLEIPSPIVRDMLDAESKGKFFHAWIRGLFERVVVRDTAGRDLEELYGRWARA